VKFSFDSEKEWGKKLFETTISHVEYGYNIRRRPKYGDVLVFYSNKQLIGAMPVDEEGRKVTVEDAKKHKEWAHNWKYIMGLDGTQKIVFRPVILVKDIGKPRWNTTKPKTSST